MISIVLEARSFAAGSPVEGKLRLELPKKAVAMERFEVVLTQEIWGRFDGLLIDNGSESRTECAKLVIMEPSGVFAVGTHEIPFSLPLDAELPPSCEQKLVNAALGVKYMLKVKAVTRGALTFNLREAVDVAITDCETAKPLDDTTTDKIYSYCCCGLRGTVDLRVTCDDVRFDRRKQQSVIVNMQVTNKTDLQVETATAEILIGATIRDGRKSATFHDTLVKCEGVVDASGCAIIEVPLPSVSWRSFGFGYCFSSASLHATVVLSSGETVYSWHEIHMS